MARIARLFLAFGVGLWPALGLAAPLKAVVLPTAGDKLATKLADQVEFNLEDAEDIQLEGRDSLLDVLDKQDPFQDTKLSNAMDKADLDVLIRVIKSKGSAYAVVLYDDDGLDVDQFDAGTVKGPADAKAVGGKAANKVIKALGNWDQKRKVRREKRDAQRKADEEKRKKQEKTAAASNWDEDPDGLAPPPDEDVVERGGGEGEGRALAEEDPPPAKKPAKKVEPERAPEKKPRKPLDEDEPVVVAEPPPDEGGGTFGELDDPDEPRDDAPKKKKKVVKKPEPRPKETRRGALAEAEKKGADSGDGPFTVEGFFKNLYTLREPSPYFVISTGPEVLAWSYTLRETAFNGRRRASTCSPAISPKPSFGCVPHAGVNLWVEAYPIRYLGLEASARVAGTLYRAATSAQTGRTVTEPVNFLSVLGGAHVAAKARFVFTFGPLPGAAMGVRLRGGYNRNLVQRQTPFIAVPGFHAWTLGGGVEAYLPLFRKHLSFDLKADFLPVVFYQEVAGIAEDPRELALPSNKTLNNPGRSAITMGGRMDAGVRGVALGGFLLEARLFVEGYGSYFTGTGRRTDINLQPIPDGKVVNLTLGLTVAVGWMFPKGLAPLVGNW